MIAPDYPEFDKWLAKKFGDSAASNRHQGGPSHDLRRPAASEKYAALGTFSTLVLACRQAPAGVPLQTESPRHDTSISFMTQQY
jgi:hypothetical protein